MISVAKFGKRYAALLLALALCMHICLSCVDDAVPVLPRRLAGSMCTSTVTPLVFHVAISVVHTFGFLALTSRRVPGVSPPYANGWFCLVLKTHTSSRVRDKSASASVNASVVFLPSSVSSNVAACSNASSDEAGCDPVWLFLPKIKLKNQPC